MVSGGDFLDDDNDNITTAVRACMILLSPPEFVSSATCELKASEQVTGVPVSSRKIVAGGSCEHCEMVC